MAERNSWLPLPLVGRREELAAVAGAFDAARRGTATALVIAGSYGIGKTRLLQAVLAEARARNFLIAHGSAAEADADVPYSVFVDAFTPLVKSLNPRTLDDLTRGTRADLARVVPALDSPHASPPPTLPPDDVTPRVRWHFTQFIERLAASPQALLLAIDNAHWADPSSVGLLQFILRHAPRAQLLVVATDNPLESRAEPPFRPASRSFTSQLTLGPLQEPDVLALLAASFRVPAAAVADFAATLFQRTMGNPFFIEEILKSLVESGTLRRLDGEWVGWSTGDFQLTATVRDVVVARVAALSDPARDLLDTLAAFSAPVPDDLLCAAAGLDRDAFVRAADELSRRDLMSEAEAPDGLLCDVTHPLLRRTVYETTNAVKRRALHGRIVAAMETCFGDNADARATDLAYHCVRAGAADVIARGFRYLLIAGRAALASHADHEAATYLQQAVELGLAPDDELRGLIEDLARARQRLGEYADAESLWLRARNRYSAARDPGPLARIERRLGTLAMLSGAAESSLTHFHDALGLARRAGRRDIEVSTLMSLSLALANLGSMDEAKAAVQEALTIVEPSGDVTARARIERGLLELYIHTGPTEVAREYSRRALAGSMASGDRALVWSAHWASGVLAGLTADADGVVKHTREAAAIARELQSPSLSAHVDEILIELASARGEWAEALRLAERAIPVARAVGPRTLLPRLLVWAGTVLLNRDDVPGAKALLDESWARSHAGAGDRLVSDVHVALVAHIGQAGYFFAAREWTRALDFAQRGVALGDRYGIVTWSVHRLLPIVGEAALWTGDHALADSVISRLRAEAPRLEHRLALLYADAIEAYLRFVRDQDPAAIEVLLGIAERGEAVPYVFQAARLRRDVARLMVAVGDTKGATRELRRAHDVFDRLGAQLELRLTREQMRQLGLRPRPRANGPRGVLTAREREIALLAAEGKADKEIAAALSISWRTVTTHVTRIHEKLGVDSRAGLVEAMRELSDR